MKSLVTPEWRSCSVSVVVLHVTECRTSYCNVLQLAERVSGTAGHVGGAIRAQVSGVATKTVVVWSQIHHHTRY